VFGDDDASLEVEGSVAALAAVDVDDVETLKELVATTPARLVMPIGNQGGPMVRERLLAPTLAEFERAGLIVWTGRRDASGQKIWRSLIEAKPSSEPNPSRKR
jgi:hypothetical protein